MNAGKVDVLIVGGGLAGLAAGLALQKVGFQVIIFEKETYPRHKVCGEYVSRESIPFLQYLGVDLTDPIYPKIDELLLTTTKGKQFTSRLPQGGVGISRFSLDDLLARQFQFLGGKLLAKSKVTSVKQSKNYAEVQLISGEIFIGKNVIAAWGKRSNIDVLWQRTFVTESNRSGNEYTAVKYHLAGAKNPKQIGMHLFPQGFCGMSSIENNKRCLCYMVRTSLIKSAGSIANMEERFVTENPFLRRVWQESEFLWDKPVTISQISFSPKSYVQNGMMMLGDGMGLISPLSGNGMSVALHSAWIAVRLLQQHLLKRIDHDEMLKSYEQSCKQEFKHRFKMSRWLQHSFFNERSFHAIMIAASIMPPVKSLLIKATHGRPFYP